MNKDLEMMNSPERWPQWPLLPVKHRNRTFNDESYTGFLVEHSVVQPTVYIGNIFFLPKDWSTLKTEKYETLEELAKDWQVD